MKSEFDHYLDIHDVGREYFGYFAVAQIDLLDQLGVAMKKHEQTKGKHKNSKNSGKRHQSGAIQKKG